MSPEADAQKDLALNPEDAENVLGGRALKKKAKKAKAAQHAAAHASPGLPTQYSTDPAVDPVADEYGTNPAESDPAAAE